MTDDHLKDTGDASDAAPTRLTRRALFDMRLDEMRQRGEPTEGMSQYAPAMSYSSEDSKERSARVLEQLLANGITSLSSSMIAEQRRVGERLERLAEEEERKWREELNQGHTYYDLYSEGCGPRPPLSDASSSTSGSMPSRQNPVIQPEGFFPLPNGVGVEPDEDQSDDARDGSNWGHSTEFRLLQDEMIEAARFRPEARSLYRTLDMKAFAGEPDADQGNASAPAEATSASAVPVGFPPHRSIDGAVELGSYLASSNYIVSLGGPPLADLRYGIIVVPSGEEELLFSGYGDHAAMSADFKDQVYTKSKAAKQGQMSEFRQKAADEMANGLDWEPELDDDDREFYRRRWLARKGTPVELADDNDAPNTAPKGPRRSEEPADDNRASLFQRRAPSSRHGHQDTGPPDHSSHSTAASKKNEAVTHATTTSTEERDADQGKTPCVREKPSLQLNNSRENDCSAHDVVTEKTDVDLSHSQGHNGDSSNKGSTNQTEPAARSPTTQGTTVGATPISPEARRALETFLSGGKKRVGTRRAINSLLPNTGRKSSPPSSVARREVLLEVAQALKNLADGELRENPGLDRRVWEAAQKELALQVTP